MAILLTQKDTPYNHWEAVDSENGDRLRIVPERGGLISEWQCKGREILYFDQHRYMDKSKSIRGGIPTLFPICGDLPGDLLPINSRKFTLRQHGFARDLPWELSLNKEKSAVLISLSDSEFTLQSFPFRFLLEIEARLILGGLSIKIKVQNRSTTRMPFSIGLHPYFRVSDLSKVGIQGLPPIAFNHLDMSEVETSSLLKNLSEGVDFLSGPVSSVTLVDQREKTHLRIKQVEPMDLTVVWTDPPRPMVCVEPWTSPRNSLISGDRKLYIEPDSIKQFECSYTIFDESHTPGSLPGAS